MSKKQLILCVCVAFLDDSPPRAFYILNSLGFSRRYLHTFIHSVGNKETVCPISLVFKLSHAKRTIVFGTYSSPAFCSLFFMGILVLTVFFVHVHHRVSIDVFFFDSL